MLSVNYNQVSIALMIVICRNTINFMGVNDNLLMYGNVKSIVSYAHLSKEQTCLQL